MTFEGSNLNFNVAVAQMRGRRFLDLIVRRGAGIDLIIRSGILNDSGATVAATHSGKF